jgi:hypothetical protein
MGDLQLRVPDSTLSTKVLLRDALHAPKIGFTVASISRMAKAGSCNIKEGGRK